MEIHPTALVSPTARIDSDVRIGPFCVVEPETTVLEGCTLESRVIIKSGTTLGRNNHVFEGAVLGGLPQHVNMPERPGKLIIGDGNTIRENVTVHRSLEEDDATSIGDNNLLMVNAHIAHDCRIGNHGIFANNCMLAGHITVADRAYISGGVAIHQFCRVGSLAMVGGQARIVKDVPPYVTVDGASNLAVGLNQIGLRRAGHTGEEVRRLKEAYRVIYRSGLSWNEILSVLREQFLDGLASHFHPFLATTTRGIIAERRMPPRATIKLRQEQEKQEFWRVRAG